MAASTGATFTSLTTTVNVFASLNAGEPLSVTRTVTALVLGPCASVGVQVNTPLVALMLAPAGAPGSRLKVKVLASASVAVAVNVRSVPSTRVLSPIGESTGAVLTSFTTIMIVSAALRAGEPLSVTRKATVFVLGPCASVGVQVNVRVPASKLAPAGAPGSML